MSGQLPWRIGLVSGEYPPLEGGVGAFTQELARALGAAGHEIHILSSRAVHPAAASRRLRDLLEPVALGFAWLHPVVHSWRWPVLTTLADWVERYELDVINIQYQAAAYNMRSPAINLAPWRLRGLVKTAVTFHDLRVPYLFPKAGPLRWRAVLAMARQAHGVIATNPEDWATLRQALKPLGAAGPLLTQIPIGSNIPSHTLPSEAVAAVRQKFGLTAADCLLGYFGFLNASKGADTLIEALARLDEHHHVLFIGGNTGASDPANNQAFLRQLQAQIAHHHLTQRVHWTGFVAEQQVSAYLHAADLMVMPYEDGVSLRRGTLMAVLAHGRPLLTTAPSTPIPELVHGQNAWFVPPNDAAALAQAVQTLAADSAWRHRLGQGAAAVAGLFTWETIAAQTAAFLHQLQPADRSA